MAGKKKETKEVLFGKRCKLYKIDKKKCVCELGLQGAAKKRVVMRESQEMFESCWERRRRKKV